MGDGRVPERPAPDELTSSKRRRQHRRRGDRLILAALVIGLVLIGWANVRTYLQARQIAHEQTELGTQRQQTLESCWRLQILRVQQNISYRADFNVFKFTAQQTAALVREHPELVPPPARKFQERQLAKLRAAARAKSWVPLTDCPRAVNTAGIHYRSPAPVPFYKREPPRSALVVPRAALR